MEKIMSVGGKVIEVISQFTRGRVYINTEEPTTGEKCAIFVKHSMEATMISNGDTVWWGLVDAYWTPSPRSRVTFQRPIADSRSDIPLERIGYSGVARPSDAPKEWPPVMETKS